MLIRIWVTTATELESRRRRMLGGQTDHFLSLVATCVGVHEDWYDKCTVERVV